MQHNDKTQSHRAEQDQPNRESKMEKAEGSRDAVNTDIAGNQGGRGTTTMKPGGELTEEAVGQTDEAGGISNRPLGEEQGRQENLPPRGERRDGRQED
jgi:hypothetical protein